MLQAIVKNKARGFLIEGRIKPPREDIITDCVFGGLKYFPGEIAGQVLHVIAPSVFPESTRLLSIQLWPRGKCEPDALIKCVIEKNKTLTVIMEAKWAYNNLMSAQLDKQWLEFGLPALLDGDVKHLLIVEHRTNVEMAAVEETETQLKLVRHLITWHDIATNLRWLSIKIDSVGATCWINDVVSVLNSAGQKPFTGFDRKSSVRKLDFSKSLIYSNSRFTSRIPISSALKRPIFWDMEEQTSEL